MSASHLAQGNEAPYYYVPADSVHPVRASFCLLLALLGAALWINSYAVGFWLFVVGLLGLFVVLFGWFGDAIGESEGGMNSKRVDASYRWSMSWFIFSEVMFFAAFFGCAVVRARRSPRRGWAIWITRRCCGRISSRCWPNLGRRALCEQFKTVGPFWLPTINTALLLTSGLTLTICPPRAARQPSRQDHFLAGTDGLAGLRLRGLPGLRIFPRLSRTEPASIRAPMAHFLPCLPAFTVST